MLQSMRDNLKGTAAIILAALFGFIIAIGGIDFFTGAGGTNANEVASVNDVKISEVEVQRAIQSQRNRLMSQFGENAPAEMLTDERLRGPVIQQLVSESVLRQAASERGMVMSKQEIDQFILNMPAFQVEGQFSEQAYRDGLRRMGYTSAGFRQYLEQSLAVAQFAGSVNGSSFVTEADARKIVALSMEERDFDYVVFNVEGMLADVDVAESEIQSYYESNAAEFSRPEKVSVKYIELKADQFADAIDVAEEDIQAQYQRDIASFEASTQRRAAHIFLEGDADDSKIAEIQAKLEGGEDFAALVSEYSDDFSSKDSGGDLGFTGGDVFPEEFEEALAGLELNAVSGPVETADGIHFIKLTEISKSEVPTLEERRSEIVASIQSSQAEREFVETLERLTDMAYNAEDLSEVAEELGLEAKTTGLFGSAGGEGIAAEAKVVAEAFSAEVKEDGNTSDVIDLSEDHAVVLQVVDHQPAGVYPLVEVAEKITDKLKRDKASETLSAQAERIKTAVAAGDDFAGLANSEGLTLETSDNTRRGGFGERGEIVAEAFKVSSAEDSPVVAFKVNSGNRVVLQLRAKRAGDLGSQDAAQRKAVMNQLATMSANSESAALEKYLTEKAEITVRN